MVMFSFTFKKFPFESTSEYVTYTYTTTIKSIDDDAIEEHPEFSHS